MRAIWATLKLKPPVVPVAKRVFDLKNDSPRPGVSSRRKRGPNVYQTQPHRVTHLALQAARVGEHPRQRIVERSSDGLDVFDKVTDEDVEFESEGAEVSEEQNKLRKLLNMSVNEIELSVRAANCLNNANITTVGELAMKSEQEMLKYRNFGKKSLNEIKAKLEQLGLSLGMKIDERLLDSRID